jgi:hypothetical protein
MDCAEVWMFGTPCIQFFSTTVSATIVHKDYLIVLALHGADDRVTEKFNVIDLVIHGNNNRNIGIHNCLLHNLTQIVDEVAKLSLDYISKFIELSKEINYRSM